MKSNLRILQLIDSLETGGAERMAINYANTLAEVIPLSALVTTRKEGALKEQLSSKVTYLFLNKKGRLGLSAVLRLRKFILQHKISVIHAHSTSFFTAILVKLLYPKVRIVWHDHYGNSEFLDKRNARVLRVFSFLFQGIISVNLKLKEWANLTLDFKNVIYLPNFVFFDEKNNDLKQTDLVGTQGKRIVCLANLRAQKNHLMLLRIAERLKESHSQWTFHLIGKDFEDEYSEMLKKEIISKQLANQVIVYGSRNDVGNILNQSDIGVLTSKSEGLPVALLEYGFYSKPVVSTNVGEIGTVISNNENGVLIKSNDVDDFYIALKLLIENKNIRDSYAQKLHKDIMTCYSEKAVITKYLDWLG